MKVMDQRAIRDEKIAHLNEGRTVYAESPELIRLMKRSIEKEKLAIDIEKTDSGCWFTPLKNK